MFKFYFTFYCFDNEEKKEEIKTFVTEKGYLTVSEVEQFWANRWSFYRARKEIEISEEDIPYFIDGPYSSERNSNFRYEVLNQYLLDCFQNNKQNIFTNLNIENVLKFIFQDRRNTVSFLRKIVQYVLEQIALTGNKINLEKYKTIFDSYGGFSYADSINHIQYILNGRKKIGKIFISLFEEEIFELNEDKKVVYTSKHIKENKLCPTCFHELTDKVAHLANGQVIAICSNTNCLNNSVGSIRQRNFDFLTKSNLVADEPSLFIDEDIAFQLKINLTTRLEVRDREINSLFKFMFVDSYNKGSYEYTKEYCSRTADVTITSIPMGLYEAKKFIEQLKAMDLTISNIQIIKVFNITPDKRKILMEWVNSLPKIQNKKIIINIASMICNFISETVELTKEENFALYFSNDDNGDLNVLLKIDDALLERFHQEKISTKKKGGKQ